MDILAASKATKSPIMLMWWYPELNVLDMEPVVLPIATAQCIKERRDFSSNYSNTQRCDWDTRERRGTKLASCGYETLSLDLVFASSMASSSSNVPNDALLSPAYDVLRSLRVTNTDMLGIMKKWSERGVDMYGHDAREAVCDWVANNVIERKNLTRSIPQGFPR
eukprot:4628793-Ditylum_brightwellii.AAC.1